MTGGRPMRAATRLVIPIDNPSESLIFTPGVASNSADTHLSGS